MAAILPKGGALPAMWCHPIRRVHADAPPFVTIARSPNFDAKRLAYFLLDPHPKMPELPLSRAAAEDVAAYIETLRR